MVPAFVFSQRKKERDTSALIIQPNRIEFEKGKFDSNFFPVPGGNDGLLIVEETSKSVSGGFEWKMHLVDTSLNIVWTQSQSIPFEGSLIGYEYFNGNFFLLYSKSRYHNEDLLVYQMNVKSQEYLTYEITTVFPVNITHFEVVGKSLILAGSVNYKPVVITYNIDEKVPKIVRGFYDGKNRILDLIVDDVTEQFTVVLSEKMKNKRFTARVKTFTAAGDLIQDNLINPGERKSLLDAATTNFSGGLQYLAGTHSRKSLNYSQGFYLSKFINGVQQFNKYYQFAELDNFFDHLSPRRESRMLNKIEKKKQKGKVKKFSYRLLVHEIINQEDNYIMIAEAYYPKYNYSSNGGGLSSFGYGGGSLFDNPYFLGYKYTHAVVVGFDRNCNILWDHTFKIDDIQSYTLEENVHVSSDEENVVLMYLQENEIRSKIVHNNEIIEGKTFNPVRLSYDSDILKSKNSVVEGLGKWFDGTLFAYGEQSIKNELLGSSRRVFYINKIQYNLDNYPN